VALSVDERAMAQASVRAWREPEVHPFGTAHSTMDGHERPQADAMAGGAVSTIAPGTRKPANAGKPWSDKDDSDLLDYDEQHYPIDDAAELLCREPHEVVARLEALKPKTPVAEPHARGIVRGWR
jgi:hypothetical protein